MQLVGPIKRQLFVAFLTFHSDKIYPRHMNSSPTGENFSRFTALNVMHWLWHEINHMQALQWKIECLAPTDRVFHDENEMVHHQPGGTRSSLIIYTVYDLPYIWYTFYATVTSFFTSFLRSLKSSTSTKKTIF